MEEVGAQVAPPIFIHHQTLAGRLCEPHPMAKKRSLPLPFQPQVQHQQPLRGFQHPQDGWNAQVWGWDSLRFVAKQSDSDALRLSSAASQPQSIMREEISKPNPAILKKQIPDAVGGEDDENLRLKLGGGSEEPLPVSRPNKKFRSGSPGSGNNNHPRCQVDNCKEDLSDAKEYHRRHKVCEVHSKASKALVGKQMQRFCQQCSRFHPLTEFDEGKRSCRRRLAGHNRRRRKTQPEDVTPQILHPGNHENTGKGDLDIINLLSVLARTQGNTQGMSTRCASVPNKDHLIQILNKINSLPLPTDILSKLSNSEILKNNVPNPVPSDSLNISNGNTSSPSTMDLLAVLSATLSAPAHDSLPVLSQSSQGIGTEKAIFNSLEESACLNIQKGSVLDPSIGGERSSTSNQSTVEDSDCQIQESLPLQLFSSSPENDSPPKLESGRNYYYSDSSNPMEEQSPSSSPPVMQSLFPMQTSREAVKPGNMSTSGEVNANVASNKSHGSFTALEPFGGAARVAENISFKQFMYQGRCTSSSGSDHSPSSLNYDAQNRTGRIIFKLFDKDPSHLPGSLREQIYSWLSHSPSEMESYIRPGCVVLSIYISMPSSSWEQLEENLLHYVSSLIHVSDSDFWRNGRFLVQTDKQLASHKDGRIRLCKSRNALSSPELFSVTPLAVVSGQETSLLLRGRNLTSHGAKIHCTHMGGYASTEVSGTACLETAYDELRLDKFAVYDAAPSLLGRCFVEVESGFRGCSFPVIIADATICQELKVLESEIDECTKLHDTASKHLVLPSGRPRSRKEVLHFLNELGWLFQRKKFSSILEDPDFALSRFRFLFIFSVERDFLYLVKTLLDILQERTLGRARLSVESLEMLSEINLLNIAVKRRCKNMVDLLINYSVLNVDDSSKYHIFQPNHIGHGGVTPLHLAACTSSADDIVDALTSDPLEVGLHCWNSLLDANGLSPYTYALMRNNHSYNSLVARKLARIKKSQVDISIGDEQDQEWSTLNLEGRPISQPTLQQQQQQRSCSRCAVEAGAYNRRIFGPKPLLHRPLIHSMLAIAAVCVCVCLLLRGFPKTGLAGPFKWENLDYGSM